MKPPAKVSLTRMLLAAADEAERIEISQEARITVGLAKAYNPYQVAKRDAFAGIVRLIETIMSDADLLDRLEASHARRARMSQVAAAETPAQAEEADVG